MIKVSVVIPTYNRASFLREAVQSILAQTFRDFEVIIVDDGSSDNTREVVEGFPSCVKYTYQENQGVSAAFNKGIEMSRGEYVAIFADDDIMLKNALEKGVAFLDQHPEAGFCHGQNYTIDECGNSLRLWRARGPRTTMVRDGQEEIARLLLRDTVQASTVLVRRSCFNEVGFFDAKLRGGEDWDMWIRLAKKYDVGYLAEPLVKVRVHSRNLQSQSGIDSLKETYTTRLNSVFNDPELGPRYARLRRKAYFGLYCNCAKLAAERGNRVTGSWYLARAFFICPVALFRGDGFSLMLNTLKGFPPAWLKKIVIRVLKFFHLW